MNKWLRGSVQCCLLSLVGCSGLAKAVDWSVNELHFQYGRLDVPTFKPGPTEDDTFILTFQHASGWTYGDNFLFIDSLHSSDNDAFNNNDIYAEFYHSLSLGKVFDLELRFGPVKDVGFITGINYAKDAKILKYLPGVRLDLDLPGFAFAHLDMMAYIDDSRGVSGGGAPATDDSWLVDFNWALPFSIGRTHWALQGHMEYLAERTNELGEPVSSWFLAQPQIRLDLGEWITGTADQLFVGIEYQYWVNKLGDAETDERAVQALLVWRL